MKILIVDDAPIIRTFLRRNLQSDGHSIVEADDGRAALELLEREEVDLIISDMLMPGMDGLQLCVSVRKDERLRSTPFIAFTSTLDSAAEERLVRSAGVDAYILKTGDFSIVRRAIDEVMRNHRSTLPALGRIDELRIAHEYSSAIARKLEQKNTELAESAREFERLSHQHELLLRSVAEGIYGLDSIGRVVFANKSLGEMVGYTPEELLGQNIHSLIHHTRQDGTPFPATECPIYETLRTGQIRRGEDLFWRKDGSSFFAESVCAPLMENEQVTGVVVLLKDVTERRRIEQDVRKQAALVEIDPNAIIVRDLNERIRFWSRQAESIYGWLAPEALGQNFRELLFTRDPQAFDLAKSVFTIRGDWEGEFEITRKDGRRVVVASRWRMIRDLNGQPEAILAVDDDVTEQRRIEAELQRHQRVQNIGTLASSVAHDLNNVLAPILMSSELFRLHQLDPTLEKLVKTIETSARRGSDMVKQILSFARGSEGQKSSVHFKSLINDLQTVARETFPSSIRFQAVVPKDLWVVEADPTLLYQTLLNLCINSRDAMPKGGILTLAAANLVADEQFVRMQPRAQPGSYVTISVTDTGTGMPPEILESIFDPFFTTKEQGKGTGLGLATVQEAVQKHGGFLTVTSEVGIGTEFKLFFPAQREVTGSSPATKTISLPRGNGQFILVADDEASIREITSATLEAYGYRVETANDGTDALIKYFAKQTEFDALITDVAMPYMDGVATVRALRQVNPGLKVLMVSGNASHRRTAENAGLHIQGFLEKPYTAETLLNALASVLTLPI